MKKLIKTILEHGASQFGPHRRDGDNPHLWVLMYHRVLPATDPRFANEEPGMIVTPDTFRQHLRTLKTLFEVMPLSQWIARRDAGQSLPARACAITFDDGWLDNYEFAFPLLQQEQLPATLFAVANMIGTSRQFWPNRLARVLKAAQGRPLPWLQRVGAEASSAATDRETIAHLIDRCKQLRDDELHDLLSRAESDFGLQPESVPALVNWDQLREMQASGLFEIGSHTGNHFRLLDGLPEATLRDEIASSKRKLEAELECVIDSFCYPNGDSSPAAQALVREHYNCAVTTRRGINTHSTTKHSLLRIGVHEDISNNATRFEARLSGWI